MMPTQLVAHHFEDLFDVLPFGVVRFDFTDRQCERIGRQEAIAVFDQQYVQATAQASRA
jgi:hypothetical protein